MGMMAPEKKVNESDASAQFKMSPKGDQCSDFDPLAVTSQWV